MKNKPVRGFAALVGEKVEAVDATCVNVIKVKCASGKVVEISNDKQVRGIGIIEAKVTA